MARTITIDLDDRVMDEFNELCDDLGMNTATAIGIFVKKSLRTHGLPFEVTTTCDDDYLDPFYSPENMAELRKSIAELESGKGVVHEVNLDENSVG